jgi:hypothetical protein
MTKIEGFNEGDRAWSAWCSISEGYPAGAAAAKSYVYEVVVMLPEIGLVRRVEGNGDPYVVTMSERLHRTQREAREWCAAEIRRGAARLERQAAELVEPRVVSV